MLHRLFVALRPPKELRDALLGLMGGIEAARWQGDGQLHLTLRYAGEIDRHRANDLADALTHVRFAPFALSVAGVGMFERKGRVHTVWAGIAPSPELTALQERIERCCINVGLEPETRKYAPHITIARLAAREDQVASFLAANHGFASAPWKVEDFVLYESHLSADGARYEPITSYPANRAEEARKP